MREIRFKAWHKKEKKMYTINEFRFVDNKLHYVALHVTDNESLLIHMYDESIILIEYTGLKDKNGKEIWEGDICQQSYDGILVESTFKVEWNETWAGFFPFYSDFEAVDPEDLEIIGNIYENPKLLKEE